MSWSIASELMWNSSDVWHRILIKAPKWFPPNPCVTHDRTKKKKKALFVNPVIIFTSLIFFSTEIWKQSFLSFALFHPNNDYKGEKKDGLTNLLTHYFLICPQLTAVTFPTRSSLLVLLPRGFCWSQLPVADNVLLNFLLSAWRIITVGIHWPKLQPPSERDGV